MSNIEYDKFISIISQNEIIRKPAVEATSLLIGLDKKELKKEDFELIDSFITATRTSMTDEDFNHIEDILNYIRI